MNDKYLSVITNFGCHYSCPYCIVKNNHLNIPKTTIHGLNNLFSEIVKNRCNWVSLSGGGDPLWKYEQHKDWYEKFFEIVDDLQKRFEAAAENTKLPAQPDYKKINEFLANVNERVVKGEYLYGN